MSGQVLTFLSYANLFSLLIPISIGLWRWSSLSASLRFAWAGLLVYFLLFLLSMLVAMGYVSRFYNVEFISYPIAGLFGSAFVVCYALAVPKRVARVAIITLGLVGGTGILIEMMGQSGNQSMSQWAIPVQTVINTIIPLIYLHYLTRTSIVSLLTVPLFWISVGRLISSLLSTLYDSLRVSMAESSRDLLIQWLCFQLAITIVCHFIYGIGLWKAR